MKKSIFIFLIIYFLYISCTGERSIFNYIKMKKKFISIEDEIIKLDKEMLSLKHQINLIEAKDLDYIDFLNQKRKMK
jgi:hypothetical protein